MRGKYSAKELAEMLDKTERSVLRQALKEGWKFVWVKGKGPSYRAFLAALLPEDVQVQINLSRLHNDPATKALAALEPAKELAIVKEAPPPALTQLKDWQKRTMEARLVILREIEAIEAVLGTNRAMVEILARARTGRLPWHVLEVIPAANARSGGDHGKQRTLSRTSLYRWRTLYKEGGQVALAPGESHQTAVPAWAPYFVQCFQKPQKPSVPEAMAEMALLLPTQIAMPNVNQVRRFQAKRSRLDRHKGRKTGSELRQHKGYIRRDTSKLLPLDVGVCDGHTFKARVAHPVHGRPFHPEICGVIDAATRMLCGFSVGLAESALTVADAIRHAATITETKPYGGVFGILYTDAGAGNTAKINTGELVGLFARMGTRHATGIPGNAQGRGLIERPNQSIWIRAAKQLPTFTGTGMDSGKAREVYLLTNKEVKQKRPSAQLLSWPQFIQLCEQTMYDYNRRPHSALPKITDETGRRYMSPLEMWAWHIAAGWNPAEHQLDAAILEDLARPREMRKVVRSEVTIGANHYYNKLLEHYDGEEVVVAYDIHDPIRVQVRDQSERLICYAEWNKNLRDYFPMSQVEQGREDRARRRSKLLRDHLSEVEAERRGFIDLPPAEVVSLADRKALVAEMNGEAQRFETFEIPGDDRGKYRLWQDVEGKMDSGVELSEREMKFYEAFRQTRAFRTFREVEAELAIK